MQVIISRSGQVEIVMKAKQTDTEVARARHVFVAGVTLECER
jgi:hypothetical protein